ncbi:MAG: VCBS repeat-containing protein [Bacteroidota bacterium]
MCWQHQDGGPFEAVTTGITPVKRAKVAWADYDQDGRPDVLVSGIAADGSNFGKLYHNTSTGFQDVSSLLGLAKPFADGEVAWGDVNADGWPDLWYSGIFDPSSTPDVNRSFILLKNNKNGTFTDISSVITDENSSNTAELPLAYGSASFIDYKGDGLGQSLMMSGQIIDPENHNDAFSQMYYYYNEYNSKGKMDNTAVKVGGINPYEYWFPIQPDEFPFLQDGVTAWADYNNDGKPDLLYLGRNIPAKNIDASKTPHYNTFLFKNNDGDTKQYMTDVTSLFPSNVPQLGYSAADWGDFNKDFYADIIMCGNDGTKNYTVLYQNNGGNSFSDVSNLLPNLPQLAYGSVQWGDYDNDGRFDLLISGKDDSGNGITKLYHSSTSGFTDESALLPNLPGVFTSAVNWIDYDHDGLLDLYITGDSQNGPVGVLYHNKGLNSSFTDQSALLPGLPQVGAGSVVFGDYDNDGKPDLYVSGLSSSSRNVSRLYHNISSGFEPLRCYSGIQPYPAVLQPGWIMIMIAGTT